MKKLRVWAGWRESVLRKNIWLPALSIVIGAMMWSVSINGILVHHKLLSGGGSGLALLIY